MMFLLHRLYWKTRDLLVSLGLAPPPRFYMRRLPAGAIRARLRGRGAKRRLRRTSLRRLLAA